MSSITFSQASGFITLQDQGRIGFANIAVPTSGAFDQSAHHLGNRLVGNFPEACSIESLRGTFKFSTDTDLVIAVTGAAASVQINGREHEMSRAVYVAANSTVAIKPGSMGLRTYIAIRGSITGDSVMGSHSYDELSQIGTPPIQAGDQFSISNQVAGSISGDYFPNFAVSGQAEIELEARPAPRWSGFSNGQVGMRLSGPELIWNSKERLASEGVITGAIQIPVDGAPLIFGPDHPTTGGYPVIAVVSRHSLNLLAQSEPGTKVRFRKAR
jgi:allophanate hydrolase subunit 2